MEDQREDEVRYLLLGPVEAVLDDGTVVTWSRASVRIALLVVLVHRRGEYVTRLDLIDAVYQGNDTASTPANVGSHLSHLRRDLGDFLVARPGGWSVPLDAATDVDEADALLAAAGGR